MATTPVFSIQNNTPLDPNKKTFIFIHGSPGDHSTYKKYLNDPELKEKYNLIAIDRPGYGKSEHYKKQIGMTEQAQKISSHLNNNLKLSDVTSEKYIVSHSYGAPLSILVDKELQTIDGLILMAGAYNPKYNHLKWYNHVAKWYLIKIVVGRFWTTSNEEMFSLNKDLINVMAALKDYKGVTHFLHGTSDTLVPIIQSQWANEMRLENSKKSHYVEFDSNHFFIWTKFKLIKEYLLGFD